jgi:D-glycero-beta-D-manno-heptose-7-phosphate kinase
MSQVSSALAASKKLILNSIPKLSGKKILVVGDIGLDEYVLGEVRRISPEAPVPVLEVESEDMRLGLAANVAQNISSLGGVPYLVSVMGHDLGAEKLKTLFQKTGVSTEHIVIDESRPTTRKTRIMAKHHHLVRVDYEVRNYLSAATEKKVIEKISALISQVDAVVVEDYSKGVISNSLIKNVIEISHRAGKKVLLDPHKTNRGSFYSGVDLIKPNFDEAVALSGLTYDDLRDHPDRVIEVGQALQKLTGAKEVVMTRGKEGMTIFADSQVHQVPTYARQVFDVTGAGDTVIAALSLGLVAGLSLVDACQLANFAAGYVVGQVGCVPCTVENLKSYIEEL